MYFYVSLHKLKIIVSLGLFLIYFFQIIKAPFFYTYHELDAKGFIEKLCENKDRPELSCNGKCFLSKVSESENQEEPNRISWEELLFYFSNQDSDIEVTSSIRGNHQFLYIDLLHLGATFEIFHPPKNLFT